MGFRNPAVWMILILLIILLFGASKLPDITRNIGKSLKIFKEEVKDLQGDTPSQTIEHDTPAPPQPGSTPHPPETPEHSRGDHPPHAPNPPTDPR